MVGDLAQDPRTDATTLAAVDRAINNAYLWGAGLKAFWRKRPFDYTSSSTPALTSGTRTYNVPSTSGAVFDSPYRLYYRRSGRYVDVPFVGDDDWLEKSATASTDSGDPEYARLIQSSSSQQIELNRAISATFISQIATLTLEYFIQIVRLSAASDEPILPGNLRHHIAYPAAWEYVLGQGDMALADRLRPKAEESKNAILKHDLTRTGRPRQLRPTGGYEPASQRGNATYDYQGRG